MSSFIFTCHPGRQQESLPPTLVDLLPILQLAGGER